MGRQQSRQEKPEENEPHQNARLHDDTAHGAVQSADQKAARQEESDKLVEGTGVGGFGCDTGHRTNVGIGIGAYPHKQEHAQKKASSDS
ncbi:MULTISPECIES: hypothetical protein [Brucella]|uniref:Uncharacterized protein n=1 Tax=Brucella intermedia TaxID=94625 RepID=A0ABR6ARH6_9HYPH|nr:hypothetical protein [Brucella intermedia]MBA8851987.1 hypothetical protein [Brucella intermedia]UXO83344.1 hypothetical protein N8I72_01580 [Brucella intermedia]WGG60028.1 hypothetical protein QA414_03615 [Brucella intermedia]